MRGLSWILWVKLEYNHKGPYEREAEDPSQRIRGDVIMEAEVGQM